MPIAQSEAMSQYEVIQKWMASSRFTEADRECDALLKRLPTGGPWWAVYVTFLTFGCKGEALFRLGTDLAGASVCFEAMDECFSSLGIAANAEEQWARDASASHGKWFLQSAEILIREDRDIEIAAERSEPLIAAFRSLGQHGLAQEARRVLAQARARTGDSVQADFFAELDAATSARERGESGQAQVHLHLAAKHARAVVEGVARAEMEFDLGDELGNNFDGHEGEGLGHLLAASAMARGSFLDGLASLGAAGLLGSMGKLDEAFDVYVHAEEVCRGVRDDDLYAEAKGRLIDAARRLGRTTRLPPHLR